MFFLANQVDGEMMAVLNRGTRFGIWITIVWLCCSTQLLAAKNVPQIFLIQNSGWMLPFYDDPNSQLKELVIELVVRVRSYGGDEQVIASFNQSIGDNISPRLHFRGTDNDKVTGAIRSIEPAHKPGRTSYTDTDFQEAIVGAITNYSPGKSCLIWIVTNNKNSPDNSQETVEKNKDFYSFLQTSSDIKRIAAFPLQMRVQSKSNPNFRGSGLMIYAIAYGDPADFLLQQMLAANAPFGRKAARLKPLNAEALTFLPGSIKGNDSIRVNLVANNTLVLSFDAAGKPEVVEIRGQFRNDFYPYDIHNASIGVASAFRGGTEGITAQLSTDKISNIPASGVSDEVTVTVTIPPVPSFWSPEVIFGSGYKVQGILQFQLNDQQLEISKNFVKSMSELFPNDPLPELFVPGESAKRSITTQPLVLQIEYPIWPMFALGGLFLFLIGTPVAAMGVFRREKIYRVSVDGLQKSYGLRPLRQVVIMNGQGSRVGVLKRGIGKPVFILDKGKECSVRLM